MPLQRSRLIGVPLSTTSQVDCCIAQRKNLLLRYAKDARLILGFNDTEVRQAIQAESGGVI
jgi:hypothetical protein